MPVAWRVSDVREIKHRVDGTVVEFSCVRCHVDAPRAAMLGYLCDEGWSHTAPDILLPADAVSLAYFWRDRPYNVYHWFSAHGASLGHYFNIAGETHIRRDTVEWWDLAVDFWLGADADSGFLDEDEVPDSLDAGTRRRIEQTKTLLVREAADVARATGELSRRHVGRLSSLRRD